MFNSNFSCDTNKLLIVDFLLPKAWFFSSKFTIKSLAIRLFTKPLWSQRSTYSLAEFGEKGRAERTYKPHFCKQIAATTNWCKYNGTQRSFAAESMNEDVMWYAADDSGKYWPCDIYLTDEWDRVVLRALYEGFRCWLFSNSVWWQPAVDHQNRAKLFCSWRLLWLLLLVPAEACQWANYCRVPVKIENTSNKTAIYCNRLCILLPYQCLPRLYVGLYLLYKF